LASFVKLGEYMSAGAAVVAFPLAQTLELCGDAIEYAPTPDATGLATAIRTLLTDRDRARRLGELALKRFDLRLSWDAIGAPRLVEAYAGRLPPDGDGR
jgi:glycosyltransferase involved in cell wall biosynthesis